MRFKSLKFLSDENLSPRVVSFLRGKEIDIVDVKEHKWFGKPDKDLLGISYQEQRFILTHDSDFGTLAIYEGVDYYGIIYFRLKILHSDNVIRVCRKLLKLETEFIPGTLVVVEEGRIRIRQPKKE